MATSQTLAQISVVTGATGAVLLLAALGGAFDYAVAGLWFLAAGIAGLTGTVCGWLARRASADRLAAIGFYLSVATVIGFGLFSVIDVLEKG